MKTKFRHAEYLVLGILSFVFVFFYSWLTIFNYYPESAQHESEIIFSWPDAMANYQFVNEFIEDGDFRIDEPLNRILADRVHPRSVNLAQGEIVPMSFLGLPIIYGLLGKLTFGQGILLFTPAVAVLAVWAFYGISRRIFDKITALLGAVLLFGFASFMYYANLSMLHTSLFLALVVGAVYFFMLATEKVNPNARHIRFAISGVLFGLAMITRSVEFVWLVILIGMLLFAYRRELRLGNVLFGVLGCLLPVAILLYFNDLTYGKYFTLGYLDNKAGNVLDGLPTEFETSGNPVWLYLKLIFAPFGLHLKAILKTVYYYGVEMFYPYFILAMAGFVVWLLDYRRGKTNQAQKYFTVFALVMFVWTMMYYGSWVLSDKLVLKNNTIGSSYTRYFLPMYIMFLPYIAYLLKKLRSLPVNKNYIVAFVLLIVIGLTGFSFYTVFYTEGDGLLAQNNVLNQYYEQRAIVFGMTEDNALIVNNRADKIFWPRRSVMMFNLDYSIFPTLAQAPDDLPIYYYSLMPDKDIDYINEKKINELNLRIENPRQVDEQFRLFEINKIYEEKNLD